MNSITRKDYVGGHKSIEIIDGNVDVVLYSEDGNKFYFYRFSGESVFGQKLDKQTYLFGETKISKFISKFDKSYDGLLNELIHTAIENNMDERFE